MYSFGCKPLYDLYPSELVNRLKKKRQEIFDEELKTVLSGVYEMEQGNERTARVEVLTDLKNNYDGFSCLIQILDS